MRVHKDVVVVAGIQSDLHDGVLLTRIFLVSVLHFLAQSEENEAISQT